MAAVSGGTLLITAALCLNATLGRRSHLDGRVLAEKQLGSWQDYRLARAELPAALAEQWRATPLVRTLVYLGGGLVAAALGCFALAGSLGT